MCRFYSMISRLFKLLMSLPVCVLFERHQSIAAQREGGTAMSQPTSSTSSSSSSCNSGNRPIIPEVPFRVYARCRPISRMKATEENVVSIEASTNQIAVRSDNPDDVPRRFEFDGVFGPQATNRDVYQTVVQPMIETVLQGQNATVLLFGTTGSGRTHTLNGYRESGNDNMDHANAGIRYHAATSLFESIAKLTATDPSKPTFEVSVSCFRIYLEEISDLLSSDSLSSSDQVDGPRDVLQLKEDISMRVYVKDLVHVPVRSAQEVHQLITRSCKREMVLGTRMGEHYRMSELVFTMHIKRLHVLNSMLHSSLTAVSTSALECFTSDFTFVRMKGNERQRKTSVTGVTGSLQQISRISYSHAAFGNVIKALHSIRTSRNAEKQHIPYRDSKITRICRDALGGNCRTAIMCTLAPEASEFEETVSICRYAMCMKVLVTKPLVNRIILYQGVRLQAGINNDGDADKSKCVDNRIKAFAKARPKDQATALHSTSRTADYDFGRHSSGVVRWFPNKEYFPVASPNLPTASANGLIRDEVHQFTFDGAFNEQTTLKEVFEDAVMPLVNEVLIGYNATVLLYGERDSGKRTTLDGFPTTGDGIRAQSAAHIFQAIAKLDGLSSTSTDQKTKYDVRFSSYVISREQVLDLLRGSQQLKITSVATRSTGTAASSPSATPVPRSSESDVVIQGLNSVQVSSTDEVNELIAKSNAEENPRATNMQDQPSHRALVSTIYIDMIEHEGGCERVRTSKISFVRLYGSERDMSSAINGVLPRHRLTGLERVVEALTHPITRGTGKHVNLPPRFVPYRDSVLTRVCQQALGGSCKTIMIAHIFPTSENSIGNLETLKFASLLRDIVNSPQLQVSEIVEVEHDEEVMSKHQPVVVIPDVTRVASVSIDDDDDDYHHADFDDDDPVLVDAQKDIAAVISQSPAAEDEGVLVSAGDADVEHDEDVPPSTTTAGSFIYVSRPLPKLRSPTEK